MTLEQLRIFVEVAQREHMTRAAEALNLTQSATSAAVAALEARHKVVLFNRIGRRIELTESGRLFLNEARAILAHVDGAELALSEMAGVRRGRLLVHASQTIASYWMPARLVAFRTSYPEIEVKLTIGNTAQVERAVMDGEAELGFIEGSITNPILELTTVDQDNLVLIVHPGHPWVSRSALTSDDLMEADWVLREPGSGTRSEFELRLKDLGVQIDRLKVVLELPSNEAVRAAVEAGGGATAVSDLVAAPGIQAGSLKKVGPKMPHRLFHAVRHVQRYRSKASEVFMQIASTPTTTTAPSNGEPFAAVHGTSGPGSTTNPRR